jgi:hypothetical protein
MTDKDKTVGGQTRPWWEALFEKWLPGLQSLHDLLDEAFEGHSRGIRDGLERAAKIADECDECHGSKHVGHYDQARCIAASIRAEASKLDGQPQRPCAADPDGRPCPDLEHCDPCAQRDIFIAGKPAPPPEPPAEERKLPLGTRPLHPLGHEFRPHQRHDMDATCAYVYQPAGHWCGQPRSAHEPTR